MKVVYSYQAKQDLQDIYLYILEELQAPGAAKHVVESIMAAVKSLDAAPERYPRYRTEPWHSRGIRFVPVQNYLVFYVIQNENETVSILRIMYRGRNVAEQLDALKLQ